MAIMLDKLSSHPAANQLRGRVQMQVTHRIAAGADIRDAAIEAATTARDECLAKGWSKQAAHAMGVLVTEIAAEVAAELVLAGMAMDEEDTPEPVSAATPEQDPAFAACARCDHPRLVHGIGTHEFEPVPAASPAGIGDLLT